MSATDVVAALNRVLDRVGVQRVRRLEEFDSLLLLQIFRRLFIGLPAGIHTAARTHADHEANFNALVSHLATSVLMMDLSHIDGAALADVDLETTRNLLEILDELHEIFKSSGELGAPDGAPEQDTPPSRRRREGSPDTAPRTHSRPRARARTPHGVQTDDVLFDIADDAEEMAPWSQEGEDEAPIEHVRRTLLRAGGRGGARRAVARGVRGAARPGLVLVQERPGRRAYTSASALRVDELARAADAQRARLRQRPASAEPWRPGGRAPGPPARPLPVPRAREWADGPAASSPLPPEHAARPRRAHAPLSYARALSYATINEDVARLARRVEEARARVEGARESAGARAEEEGAPAEEAGVYAEDIRRLSEYASSGLAGDAGVRAYAVLMSLLRQYAAELRRADRQQRASAELAARNALRDERILWIRRLRREHDAASWEASIASRRGSRGAAYRQHLYRLALKLQRERLQLGRDAEAERARARRLAAERSYHATEGFYREQIQMLEGRIRGARSDRQTRERAQRDVLRSMEREVHEQQMASIEQLRAQLAAIDGIDDDYDVGKGEEFMHRLYNAAHNLRARGRRPRHSSGV